jgi:hypothetical protein
MHCATDMKEKLKQDWIAWLMLLISGILLCTIAYMSPGSYGGEDSFMHYLFARYAPVHPHLYLDHWAKPLFTLLASPFAVYGGFTGIRFFNILCGLTTAWSAYLIARNAGWSFPWMSIPVVLFNALFFVTLLSGLTEPLFACMLMISILLLIKRQYVAACIVLSFLPFVRSEGNLMFPLFILAMAIEKRWKYIPLLATGSVVMSIIGGILKGDYFWIITENPYQGAAHIYGSGSFFHFFRANREMWGVPQSLMILAGIAAWLLSLYRNSDMRKYDNLKTYILIGGSALVYILAHSWFWSQGLYGSFGLIRVMAAIVPLGALIAVFGFQYFANLASAFRVLQWALIAGILSVVVYDPFFQYRFPYALDTNQALMKVAANWYRTSECKRVFTDHPYFSYAAQIDYFDPEQRLSVHRVFTDSLRESDVVVWESHLAPNEGGVSESQLNNASNLKSVGILDWGKNFKVRLYRVYGLDTLVLKAR